MRPDEPKNLNYAPPNPSGRTVGTMLADAFIGICWIIVGLIGGLIAVVLTEAIHFGRSFSADDVPDVPFRWVAEGCRRIYRGKRKSIDDPA